MPTKNSRKIYVENGIYHIYNRGVEKRKIFMDEADCAVFLGYLKEYLSPPKKPVLKIRPNDSVQGLALQRRLRPRKNYTKEIELLAFCLIPNHFHLLLKQRKRDSIKNFIHSLLTRYTMYFNKRYDRVGTLYQDRFKAVMVSEEPYFLHLSRYIHLNPAEHTKDLLGAYSSYSYYLGKKKAEWVKPDLVLSYFNRAGKDFLKGTNTYKSFVEKFKKDSGELLGKLTLE